MPFEVSNYGTPVVYERPWRMAYRFLNQLHTLTDTQVDRWQRRLIEGTRSAMHHCAVADHADTTFLLRSRWRFCRHLQTPSFACRGKHQLLPSFVRACSRAIHWTGRRVGTARCLAFYERQVDYTRVLVFISYVFVFFLLFILRVDESAEARRAVAVIGGV